MLVRLTVRAGPSAGEEAAALACAVIGSGCRERREADGGVTLEFWAPRDEAPSVPWLRRALADAGLDAHVEEAPETGDWGTAMRAFHRPFAVGPLWCRPPWEPARAGRLDVVVDPGMAFGTGQHATTRSCLELLAGLDGAGSLLDVGSGSGILAVAARRLGHDPVWAIDDDPHAVAATRDNARANGVALRVARGRVGADPLPRADVVAANLTAGVVVALAAALPDPAPERAILSGLRPSERVEVERAWAARGLEVAQASEREGWATLMVQRR